MAIDYSELMKEFKISEMIDLSRDLARHPNKVYRQRKLSRIKRIVVHTTDWGASAKTIAEYDIKPNHISETGCPAITYHELIGISGNPYKTLDYEEVSWHAGMWNLGSVAIALAYKCSNKKGEDVYKPKRKLMTALHVRCGEMCLDFGLTPDKVIGHRELKGTGWFIFKGSRRLRKTCPGINVDLELMRKNIARYMQIVLGTNGFYTEAIDGIFGTKSKEALTSYRISESDYV
jgi:hypothetical protein